MPTRNVPSGSGRTAGLAAVAAVLLLLSGCASFTTTIYADEQMRPTLRALASKPGYPLARTLTLKHYYTVGKGSYEQGWFVADGRIIRGKRALDGVQIYAAQPATRVLFLTSYADDDAVLATILAGADGFLLKDVSGDDLLRAVRKVAGGQSILDGAVTQRVLARVKTLSNSAAGKKEDALSPQEQKVLALVAEGKTNKEIANALALSEKTVGNYLSNIFQKLQVTRRAQAAVYYSKRFPQP